MMKKRLGIAATVLGLVAAGVAGGGNGAFATPAKDFSPTQVIVGRFGDLDIHTHDIKLKTKDDSDVYVVTNVIKPGGHSGWHSHPGPSLITVKEGTVTAYDADDPTCTGQVYSAGMGFVDPGDGHVHLLRNEGPVDAVTVAVQFLPAGAPRRIDAPDPGVCHIL